MSGPRIGELFAGYGGLGMGVQAVLGGEVAWFSEFDAAPSKILAHHWPDVPNHGDITLIDWSTVEPVDILTGGFPCQDVSLAGARAGLKEGTRSGLWSEFARAIAALQPEMVVIENVRGLLSATAGGSVEPDPWGVGDGATRPVINALGAVLGDLADLGYDAEWCGLRAADAGAPHARYRVFIVAHRIGERRGKRWAESAGSEGRPAVELGSADAAHAASITGCERNRNHLQVGRATIERGTDSGRSAVAHARGDRLGGNAQRDGNSIRSELKAPRGEHADRRSSAVAADPEHIVGYGSGRAWHGRPELADGDRTVSDPSGERGHEGDRAAGVGREGADGPSLADEHSPRSGATEWGDYRPAIERWEMVTGRRAPAATRGDGRDGSHRLSALFVEWMMGLPAGHVTDTGLTRNEQLKALGNGVVWQQAALALRVLLERRAA